MPKTTIARRSQGGAVPHSRTTKMRRSLALRRPLFCAVSLLLAACATQPTPDAPTGPKPGTLNVTPSLNDAVGRAQDPGYGDRARLFRGSGVVVKGQQPGGAV